METTFNKTGKKQYKVKLPTLHNGQLAVAQSNKRFKVLVAGRRWGKTRLGVWLCIAKASQGKRAWWVAPTYAMALEGWKELRTLGVDYGFTVNESQKTLYTTTGGSVTVRSADNPDRLRGAGLDFIVLDECAYIKENVWREVLRPTLTERRGSALFISTPKGFNWFSRLYDDSVNYDDWERWQLPTSTNPYVPLDELAVAKQEIGSYLFSQEYEAQFVEAKGGLIHREWFKYYDKSNELYYDKDGNENSITWLQTPEKRVADDTLRIVVAVDLATSTKDSADYTVALVLGLSQDNDVFVLDLVRNRLEAPDVLKMLQSVYDKWQPEVIGVERAGYQLAFIQMARAQTNLPIRELKADKDKLSRALPLSAKMEAGQVYFPRNAVWYSDLEKELLQFPAGEFDDQVDALSYAILLVARRKEFRAY
jgi:predicted phage terminase large subunit-like protein